MTLIGGGGGREDTKCTSDVGRADIIYIYIHIRICRHTPSTAAQG